MQGDAASPPATSGVASTATSAPTAAVSRSSVPAAQRGGRANPRLTVAGPSRLSERAAEEYHYVGRDLRNIGMLVIVMALILVAAIVVFGVFGLGRVS